MRRERVWSAHGWLERAREIDTRRRHIRRELHRWALKIALQYSKPIKNTKQYDFSD